MTQPKELKTITVAPAEERFREFREQAYTFSRSVSKDFHFEHDPSKTVELNVQLTKAVFGKWSIEILVTLYSLKSAGFEELRKDLGTISSRVLSHKLRVLEERKLVKREIIDSRPPRSNYKLTEKGLTAASLGEPVLLYLRWTENIV